MNSRELSKILRSIAAALVRKPGKQSTKPRRKLRRKARLKTPGAVRIDAGQPILQQLRKL